MFELDRLDGGRAVIREFLRAGTAALLVFTDPGCGPCQALVPDLAAWQSRAPGDIAIVPVARADAETGRSAYGAVGLDNILLDPTGEAATVFGVVGFPTGIIIAANGHIAASPLTGAQAIIEYLNAALHDRNA